MAEFVTFDVAGGIATLRIARPPMNAVNLQVLRELTSAAASVSASDEVVAVIVYGDEKIFAAGDDVVELAEPPADRVPDITADRHAAIAALAATTQPTVAAVSGYALGGGLELALAADRRIVGDNVKLGFPRAWNGLLPGAGTLAGLTALIGPSKAKDLVFTGRFVSADEALALGLVDEVVAPDDVYDAARRWATRLVGSPSAAQAAARAALAAAKAAIDAQAVIGSSQFPGR